MSSSYLSLFTEVSLSLSDSSQRFWYNKFLVFVELLVLKHGLGSSKVCIKGHREPDPFKTNFGASLEFLPVPAWILQWDRPVFSRDIMGFIESPGRAQTEYIGIIINYYYYQARGLSFLYRPEDYMLKD